MSVPAERQRAEAEPPAVAVVPEAPRPAPRLSPAERRRVGALLLSVLLVSLCGIIYQLQIGAISSYLLGDSVQQFSFTIGLFMFALGVGSWLSKLVREHLVERLLGIEIALGLVGGMTSYLLFAIYTYGKAYYAGMIGTTLAVGILVGLEVPLLARVARRYSSLREALAEVLTWDYVGGLIGAVLFPLFLLPTLGLITTAPVVGLVNILVTILLLSAFWADLRRPRAWMAAVALGAAALVAAVVLATPIGGAIDRRLYLDEVVLIRQSPYQKIVVTRWNQDTRLFLNGHLQFSSIDEHRYHEALVHPAMGTTVNREEVLILGGGDGLAVREILKYPEVRRVTVVDIDPAVTELARTFPPLVRLNRGALFDTRVRLVHEDAFTWLARAPADERFGVILSDLPDPTTETLAKLYSVEFFRLVRQHLAMGGVFTVQSTSPFFARQAYWAVEATLRAAKLETLSYHVYVPSFGDWGFHLAGHQPPRLPEALPVETKFLTPEVLRASLVFGRDLARLDSPVNSLQQPVLQGLYRAGWTRWTVP
jgi:spermidine synthase